MKEAPCSVLQVHRRSVVAQLIVEMLGLPTDPALGWGCEAVFCIDNYPLADKELTNAERNLAARARGYRISGSRVHHHQP